MAGNARPDGVSHLCSLLWHRDNHEATALTSAPSGPIISATLGPLRPAHSSMWLPHRSFRKRNWPYSCEQQARPPTDLVDQPPRRQQERRRPIAQTFHELYGFRGAASGRVLL